MIRYRQQPSYAGVALEVVSFSTQLGRDVAEHRPSRGRGAQLDDRGLAPRRDSLQITLTGTDGEIEGKRARLVALRGSGEPRLFVHPLDGQWHARLGDLSENTSASECGLSMTLIEDVPFTARHADAMERVTIKDVESAAAMYDAAVELLTLPLPADAPTGADTTEMVAGWGTASTATQQTQLQDHRSRGNATKDALFGSSDPAAIDACRTLQALRGTVEMYQVGLQYARAAYHTVTVASAMPLARYLTDIYGGAEYVRLMDEVIRLNSIANPLRLAAGTALRLPRV